MEICDTVITVVVATLFKIVFVLAIIMKLMKTELDQS